MIGRWYVTCQIPLPSISLLRNHLGFLSCPSLWPDCSAFPSQDLTGAGSHTGIMTHRCKKGRRKPGILEHWWQWGGYFKQQLLHTKGMQLIVRTCRIPQSLSCCHAQIWINNSNPQQSATFHCLGLIHKTIYHHRLLVYNSLVIGLLCLELMENVSLGETLLNNIEYVVNNYPLILHITVLFLLPFP